MAALAGYHMTREGKVVIFKNGKFDEGRSYPDLKSADADTSCLYNFWQENNVKQLKIQSDLTVEKMKKEISSICAEKDNKDCDFLVLAFLTYGDHGLIYGRDGKSIALQDLLDPLKAHNCTSLAGKPKIIIIQTSEKFLQADAASEKVEVIPGEADFLYLWSRLPADKYTVGTPKGSVFIQTLVEKFEELKDQLDVITIMTRVIQQVSDHISTDPVGRELKGIYNDKLPFTISQLTKKLYLPSE